ncbi:MAG TPA: hypothetical protein VMX35_12190 [Acidobacteriota bacterium]|nr:hypothetical protein [Acidobacteriota bacterium]
MKSIGFRLITLLAVPVFLCGLSSGAEIAVTEDPFDEIERALKTDSFEEALILSESLAAFSPLDAEAQALYGLALLRSGRYREAELALLAALGLDEKCAEAHLGMGRLAAGMNRRDRAVLHFREAIKSGRFRGEAFWCFGALLADSGDFSAALQVAEAAPGQLDYLGDNALTAIRRRLEFYRFLAGEPCFQIPASFQKTTVDLMPRAGTSGDEFETSFMMSINGEESGPFRISTAFTEYLVVSSSLADRLGLQRFGSLSIPHPGADAITGEGTLIESLEIGGLKMSRVPAAVVADSDLAGGAQGIVGIGFLKRFNFSLDISEGTLQLTRGDRPDLILLKINPERAAARVPLYLGPLPATLVSVNGLEDSLFVIDLESETTIIDSSWFDAQIAPGLPRGTVAEATAVGPGGVMQEGRLFSANKFKMSGLELSDQPLVVLDLSRVEKGVRQRVAGIIGRDILNRFRLHFSLSQPEMILEIP